MRAKRDAIRIRLRIQNETAQWQELDIGGRII
jgi:hypothetical protein